jgi:hypothetical protein
VEVCQTARNQEQGGGRAGGGDSLEPLFQFAIFHHYMLRNNVKTINNFTIMATYIPIKLDDYEYLQLPCLHGPF